VQSTGYAPELTAEDHSRRERALDRLHRAFDVAVGLGSEIVVTGAGSHDPASPYAPHPDNHRRATRQRLTESLREGSVWAAKRGIPLVVEAHVLTALDTAAHVADVLGWVDSPWVRVNVDPVNLLATLSDVWVSGERMRANQEVLAPWSAPSVHVKDVAVADALVLHIDECPPGQGVLDYDAFFGIVAGLPTDSAVIVEHLAPAPAVEALHWLRHELDDRGFEY
jgi:sugar phosphate isomerase/epimerase